MSDTTAPSTNHQDAPCHVCHGWGWVAKIGSRQADRCYRPGQRTIHTMTTKKCPACNGSGKEALHNG